MNEVTGGKPGRKRGSKNIDWSKTGPIVIKLIEKLPFKNVCAYVDIPIPTVSAWLGREHPELLQRVMGRPKLLDDSKIQEIVELKNNNIPIKAIAKTYGVSIHTVYRVLKEHKKQHKS